MIKRGGGYTTGLMDDRYTHNPRVLSFLFFSSLVVVVVVICSCRMIQSG